MIDNYIEENKPIKQKAIRFLKETKLLSEFEVFCRLNKLTNSWARIKGNNPFGRLWFTAHLQAKLGKELDTVSHFFEYYTEFTDTRIKSRSFQSNRILKRFVITAINKGKIVYD